MWTYKQSTGALLNASGAPLVIGYSGKGTDKNRSESQTKHNLGPIPCGTYGINSPRDTAAHGPYVLPLTPAATNEMFGRDGFLIHGDSITHPGDASNGCIIVPRWARQRVWESGDHQLTVVV